MKRVSIRRVFWFSCFLFLVFPATVLLGIDVSIDPHGKEGLCEYCHTSKVVKKGKADFRLGTVEVTCVECHKKMGQTLEDYLHRVLPDVTVEAEMIPYFLKQGDFSCHSCHYVMCQSNSRKELERRNPHIQLNEDGELIEKTCLFCHKNVPDYKNTKPEDVVMRYDITYVCSLCHAMSTQKRGLGFGERMTPRMVHKKVRFEKQYDVSLPLGPNNSVVCASCHNPHQAGVILGKGGPAATSSKHRLRVDDVWQPCVACHWGGK
jgi:hypothetical protein